VFVLKKKKNDALLNALQRRVVVVAYYRHFLSPRNPFLAFFSFFVLIEDNLIKLTTFFTSAILSIQPVLKDETY